jgi:ribose 5-phosphate isomerase A
MQAIALEEKLKQIVGVIENGIFAKRTADIVLFGAEDGVETVK